MDFGVSMADFCVYADISSNISNGHIDMQIDFITMIAGHELKAIKKMSKAG